MCLFPKPFVILKFCLFLAIYSKPYQFTVVKLGEKYVLEPPYTKKKKRVKKLCSSILKSAVVRCFQCLLWKNIKVFQNDGQILMQSCTGIFDLLFQTKLVDIKQVIKISALSKVQC